MVTTRGKEAIALLLVVVVVLAALAAGVMLNNGDKKDNPNGILGMYNVADYTQFGTNDGGKTWMLVDTTTGEYDGEQIRIDSYKDGVITATCYLGGGEFPITGYYDPETGAFGYGSYYNYSPGSKSNVIDALHGCILNDTMYLRGYTISADDQSKIAYTFNFTFVKEGGVCEPITFRQVIDTTAFEDNGKQLYTKIDPQSGAPTAELKSSSAKISLVPNGFHNGIYDLNLETKNGYSTHITAVTMYQDSERTFLRGVFYHTPTANQEIIWMCVQGNQMYAVEDIYDEETNSYMKDLTLFSRGEDVKEYRTYDLDRQMFDVSISHYSSMSGKFSDSEFTSAFTNRLSCTDEETGKVWKSFVTPMLANGAYALVNVFPDVDYVTFNTVFQKNGQTYYSDIIGYIDGKGNVVAFGLYFSANGDVMVSHGTMNKI